MNGQQRQTRVMREIEPQWERLMQIASLVNYGEAKIVFQAGRPVRIKFAIKDIRLDDEKEFQKNLKIIPLA